jgi:energy-coupling factor transporter ATP-binding protein EcfA2
MPLVDLPTVWNVYNLRGSPFFQDTLLAAHERRSLDLFVGRSGELAELRAHLRGRDSSRQAVAGASGVGKTTLVQTLKAVALEDGYLTTDSLVPFVAGDTPEALFGRVLSAAYDTVLANRPTSGGSEAMQAAQQMVRAARLATGGVSASAFGVGGGVTRGVTVMTPKDVLVDGPRVLRDLLTMVRGSDARGLLLHLNNLESLSGRDLARAADLLQSLRDPMLMHDGLHVVLVGTTDAVNDVLDSHAQVRNVFRAPLLLEPLSLTEVHGLLRARYERWRLRDDRPARPPIEGAAVDRLFEVFQGDLRGLLKALDDGVEECIGLGASVHTGTDGAPVPPVGLSELSRALQTRYAAVMRSELDDARIEQLVTWAADPGTARTQRDLAETWELSQGTVSTALATLVQTGYAVAHPRQGNAPIQYTLSGKSRIIAGLE